MWSISVKAKGKNKSHALWRISRTSTTSRRVAAGRRSTRLLLPFAFCLFPFAILFSACRQDMHDQPKYKPYAPSNFFEDNRSSRPLVEGTVPRGSLSEDSPLARVVMNEQAGAKDKLTTFPFVITAEVL